jgi:hypothetical protein
MKYETPELTALAPAINAIQGQKDDSTPADGIEPEPNHESGTGAYQDWE